METVQTFKLLGSLLSNNMKWQENSTAILKKARQRMYFLRTLKVSKINCNVLHNFYKATIESVLTHAIVVWGGGVSKENERKLNSVITNAAKHIGHELPFINAIYRARLLEEQKRL